MGLLVYKFSDYRHTAEREQFRVLCKCLQEKYGSSPEPCVFVANYNVNDIELDAFLMKPDALICVEFKNYGGEIIAAENGEWMLSNGTIIKGGSGKSVYQQACLNRTLAKKGIKQLSGLTNRQVANMSSLVVFNQPITALDSSRLSPAVKMWLHIADNNTFREKVEDITDENLYLDHQEMLRVINALYFDRRYLVEEYSNSEILDPNYAPTPIVPEFRPDQAEDATPQEILPKPKRIRQKKLKIVGHIDLASVDPRYRTQDTLDTSNSSSDTTLAEHPFEAFTSIAESTPIIEEPVVDETENEQEPENVNSIDEETKSEIDELSGFIKQVFNQICKGREYSLHVYRYNDPNLIAALPDIHPRLQWFLIIQINDAISLVDKVRRFMGRDVNATNEYLTFEIGMPIDSESANHLDINSAQGDVSSETKGETSMPEVQFKFKNRTTLPSWLDRLIFDKAGAIYNPNYRRHSYNLDLSEEEVLNYLGTYFPRSYAEAFCIYDDLCNQSAFLDSFKSKSQIEILDLGCGTGGELVGLVSALEKHIPSEVPFHIEAIDGNNFSLEKFKEIMAYITKKSHRQYEVVAQQRVIRCTDDIESIAESYSDRKFDIIQMCKFGCELESHRICKMANPYQLLLTIFGKLLSNESVFLLLDVTTLSNTDNHFYPSLINMGVRDSLRRQPLLGTLVPTCCHLYGDDCPSPCFTQKEFYVRHSKKIGDLSKVAYRIVAPKKFIEKFGIAKEEFQYIIKSGAFSDENICRFSTPEAPFVDAYKLNAK